MERLFEEDGSPGGGLAGPPPEPVRPEARSADSAAPAIPGARPPLAARLRPDSLADFAGQRHLLSEGAPLRVAIESGRPHSMVLHGPPGTGKTTLARLLAHASGAALEQESAVAAGKAEIRAVIDRARERRRAGRGTVLFLDEIHRFNRAQQDALLPAVEDGLLTLIGATTENPYFEVNRALLSRLRVYELEPLDRDSIRGLLERALAAGECGPVEVEPAALVLLCEWSAGDARSALGALELACATAGAGGTVSCEQVRAALARPAIAYDRAAEGHYDTISAWIKATRGSDPDASLYYLAVMLEAGEDPRFIARRMVILASEDVGNADPQALSVATAAAAAVDRVGLPEAEYPLAQAAIYLSLAPKSDAAKRAIGAARQCVREHGAPPPPAHLRSGGRADGAYDYPHAQPGHFSPQPLLPPELRGRRFYEPDEQESELARRLAELDRARGLR